MVGLLWIIPGHSHVLTLLPCAFILRQMIGLVMDKSRVILCLGLVHLNWGLDVEERVATGKRPQVYPLQLADGRRGVRRCRGVAEPLNDGVHALLVVVHHLVGEVVGVHGEVEGFAVLVDFAVVVL